ncbi:hypothetical protein [Streptomyces antimycoticus]|nr:hypothetical protein [Streptomyces antimycoticus]
MARTLQAAPRPCADTLSDAYALPGGSSRARDAWHGAPSYRWEVPPAALSGSSEYDPVRGRPSAARRTAPDAAG